jgi:hypothetical protein
MAAVAHPELVGKFPIPKFNAPNRIFLYTARELLQRAIASRELLAPFGLGDTLIEDLTAALDQLEGATVSAHDGRAGHVTAVRELKQLTSAALQEVVILDTFFRERYANDPGVLSGWQSAKNTKGPFHRAEAVPPAEPGSGAVDQAA